MTQGDGNQLSKVKKIFFVTLALNLIVSVVKLVLSSWTHSLSLFSDGLHSLLDATSNIVALIALRVAERPPDEDHPYGHRKFETLGAMAISGLLCLAAWEILANAFHRMMRPGEALHFNYSILGGLLLMIGLNITIALYERHWGKKLHSSLLIADSEHTKSDAMASILSLSAILASAGHLYWVDTLGAILIVVLILRSAYRIIKDSVLTLSDAQILAPGPIQKLVESIDDVKNCHMIRSHGPRGQIHVDLHIVVEPTLSAQRAFEIENEVTRRLKEVYPEISEVTIRHQPRMPQT